MTRDCQLLHIKEKREFNRYLCPYVYLQYNRLHDSLLSQTSGDFTMSPTFTDQDIPTLHPRSLPKQNFLLIPK